MTALASSAIAPARRIPDRFNTVACLAVGAAIMGYCVAEPAPALAAFSMPVLALGWWLARGGTPTALPRAAINLLVIAAIARAFFSVANSGNAVVSHLSEFLVLIQLIKLFDRKAPRDEAQVLCLSLFVVLGALLTSNALGVGLLLLVYTPLATAAAMLLQIRAGLTRAMAAEAGAPPTRLAADLSRPGPRARAARRQFGGVVATAVVMAFALAAVAFIVTPRNIAPDRLGRIQPRGASIGFNDEIRLGRSGMLEQQSTPVMDVAVSDNNGNDMGSEHRALYLRGAVLTDYFRQSQMWTNPREDRRRGRYTSSRHVATIQPQSRVDFAAPIAPGLVVKQDVFIRSLPRNDREPYLFALATPFALETGTTNDVTVSLPDLTMRRQGNASRLRYTVWSDPRGVTPLGDQQWPRIRRRPPNPFRQGPVRDLAVRILEAERIPLEPEQRTPPEVRSAALAFINYLRRDFTYTLQMVSPPDGRDPIEWFLLENKSGHCEDFASALVAMCQAVDIEARLVTGYLTTEYNPMMRQYVVRQSHAHAWAEVKIGERWQMMDPSPPSAIAEGQRRARGLVGRLRQLYEAIDFAWNRSVVSYDETRQSNLLTRLIESVPMGAPALRWLQETSRRVADMFSSVATPATGLAWLIMVLAWLGAMAFVVPRLRRLRWRRRGTQHDPALRRLLAGTGFYERALAALARAGLGKPDARPPLAHAAAVAAADPEAAADFERLARLYYHVRFGGRHLSADEAGAAQSALRALTERLSATGHRRARP